MPKLNYFSEEARLKRSETSSRAAEARWSKNAETEPHPDYHEYPENMYRLTFENLMTGKTEVLTFHPGTRKNNKRIDVNGKFWKVCGFVGALERIVTSCYKMERNHDS